MGCQGGGENLIKGMLSGRVAKHGLPRGGGGEIYKRNVVLELESLKPWVAKGGGGKFDQRNAVRYGRKAWVAKGGGEKF